MQIAAMVSRRTILRLGLAALASGAAAGLLLPLIYFLGALALGGWPADGPAVALLIEWLQVGFVAGLVLATLPAFLAGASMRALGARFGAARRPLPWAAAGAFVAAALWALAYLAGGLFGSGFGELDFLAMSLLAASLPAGAGAALVFRAAVRLGERLPDDPSAAPS